jgi:hypothetical protein
VSARPAARHRLLALACVLPVAVGVGACGRTDHPSSAINDGVYVQAGPITYQLEISRELNQYSTEDSQYIAGIPPADRRLGPDQIWYGVFLWAKNQTRRPQLTSDNLDIVDTEGNHYYPIPLNRTVNPYAWSAQNLAPGAVEPGPDTTASFGPTQGGLLLFKLPLSVYDNRPLQLEIRGPSGQLWGTIALDL